jgi:hypothetical protein
MDRHVKALTVDAGSAIDALLKTEVVEMDRNRGITVEPVVGVVGGPSVADQGETRVLQWDSHPRDRHAASL